MADHEFYQSPHMTEQAIWRLEQIKLNSPQCLTNNQCKVCGCTPSELVYSDNACEGNCFPPLMEEETWKKFKKDNNIVCELN